VQGVLDAWIRAIERAYGGSGRRAEARAFPPYTVIMMATSAHWAKGRLLTVWTPEDKRFWETQGKAIAGQNLWLSIPALFLAFAVWGDLNKRTFTYSKHRQPFDFSPIAGIASSAQHVPHERRLNRLISLMVRCR
jgi:hypothetical protein